MTVEFDLQIYLSSGWDEGEINWNECVLPRSCRCWSVSAAFVSCCFLNFILLIYMLQLSFKLRQINHDGIVGISSWKKLIGNYSRGMPYLEIENFPSLEIVVFENLYNLLCGLHIWFPVFKIIEEKNWWWNGLKIDQAWLANWKFPRWGNFNWKTCHSFRLLDESILSNIIWQPIFLMMTPLRNDKKMTTFLPWMSEEIYSYFRVHVFIYPRFLATSCTNFHLIVGKSRSQT